ncbi:uncharacterized protein N7479_004299 [Penicillium vulpinum]|uniref:uncharacterized protein n=1 Tax=Penicillium vulpinum TaxID=29845 RepID=UPI00254882AE|nr:uncharacterized protein N7479_004299 [Penicillium vulpinum]KAJ5964423.1 hypothetical protein N7479_004299 [Penicillium vulpinum]
MYLFDVLKAWHYFREGRTQLEDVLRRPGRIRPINETQGLPKDQAIEKVLYWSFVKFECISHLDFQADALSAPLDISAHREWKPREKRSLLYFQAEIDLRRIMNQAFTAMGAEGSSGWIQNFKQILSSYHILNERLNSWYAALPSQVKRDLEMSRDPTIKLFNKIEPIDELAHQLHMRFLNFQEWIHRPFLYYVIHQPTHDPYIRQAAPLARKCLEFGMDIQLKGQPNWGSIHIHERLWLELRGALTQGVLLIGAICSKKLDIPEGRNVTMSRTGSLWARRCADLNAAVDVYDVLMETAGRDLYAE